ncbi:MAG: polyketide cyclase [Gammaproteobacteria bacterium]|nr:polyketide cyclase [Gammaproteobacteria bacterium]MCW5583781.1 polyketide cyclase [Gammaproteobacteria bacterium]
MWIKEYSKIYHGIKKEDIWQLWADVNNWPKWDKELEYCKMEAPFTQGSRFILKPAGGPKIEITLSHVTPNKKFTDYCKFLGATMYVDHELEETTNGLRIKSTITVTGILGFLWWQIVAKNVVNSVPKQMDALVELARYKNAG